MASTKFRARLPLLLLLGILFLASVTVCLGTTSRRDREGACREQEDERQQPWRRPGREREDEDEDWSRPRHREDPDERERPWEKKEERTREWRRESEERDRPRRPRHQTEQEESDRPRRSHRETRERFRRPRESEEEEEGSSSSSESSRSGRRNPFHFRSSRFSTQFENQNGHVRVLQRFDERSKLFEHLENYRVLEYKARPQTLVLPHHNDADSILVIQNGRAILTVVNPNDRDTYNLERGDALVLPAGTTAYLANRDNDDNLRVVQLLIPVNRPGRYQPFFPSSTESQESYLNGFSRNILEAAFNAEYNEIERVLLEGGDQGQQQQSQEEGVIVKLSQDQIQELSRHAKSSSRKRISSESEPFNLRSRNPVYSNKFGRLFEITPKRNPQLRELDIFLSEAEIKEGSLYLPHYHSRSTLIIVVNEGRGELELVAQRQENQQQRRGEEEEDEDEQEEEQQPRRRIEAQRFRARLSPGDVVVIPASHPFAINASSDLNLLAFGINAEYNQRNFLAGNDDNVISQIERPVKELAFPGSAEDVESLIKNQRNSHFASAQPQQQQREEGGRGRRDQLSSILGAFF